MPNATRRSTEARTGENKQTGHIIRNKPEEAEAAPTTQLQARNIGNMPKEQGRGQTIMSMSKESDVCLEREE